MFRSLALLFSSVLAGVAGAAPGDLDPSFGTNGVASFRIGSSAETIHALGRQPDGKLIAVGVGPARMLLARYHPSGGLDTTFGSGGVARHEPYGLAKAVFVQDDGKIVVLAGCTGAGGEFDDSCLHRFESDGTRDPAFAIRAFGREFSVASALVRQPDGKLLLAARTPRGFGAVRLLPSGVFDPTFGENGIAALTAPNMQALPGTLALQADGRIVVFGVGAGVTAARFDADGKQDAGFAASTGTLIPRASVQQPDGKIVVAGCRADPNNGPSRLRVLRLLPDGKPDPGFAAGGEAEPVPTRAGCPHSLLLRPDGALVTDVDPGEWPGAKFRVVQVLPNGAPDPNFGDGAGLAEFQAGGDADRAFAMLLQPDGKVVVAGDRWGRDFALIRLHFNGALDSSFGMNGVVNTDLRDGRWGTLKAVRLAGGATYVLSHLYEWPSGPLEGDVGVTRLLPNGTPDPSFGQGGHAVATMSSHRGDLSAGGVRVFAVHADGRIVVGGSAGAPGSQAAEVLRFSASGEHDALFGASARASVGDRMTNIHAIEAMRDGRVVIAGVRYTSAPLAESDKGTVMRLLPDGSPDPSFNIAEFDVERRNHIGARLRLALQSDGRLVVSDFARDALSAMRLLENGLVDPTFGTGGRAVVALGTPHQLPLRFSGHAQSTTLLHSDGRMTLTGTSTPAATCPRSRAPAFHAAIARLRPSGSPAGGPSLASMGRAFPYLETARLDAHERIVAAGIHMVECGPTETLGAPLSPRLDAPALFRFTPSGTPDARFGSGGVVALAPPGPGKVVDVATQADGKIVAIVDVQAGNVFQVHRLDNSDPLVTEGPAGDGDGDSIPDIVEATESRDSAWRDNDIFNIARLFAMQQYRDFLGREGDAAGVDHWTSQLTSGAQTRAKMAETFFNSAEFQGVASPVARLYFAYFLRIPDYDGLDFWITQYRAGNSLVAISNAFAASPEFASTYGPLDNAGFVDRVYRNVLGRAPDAPGLAFWKGRIDGGMTRGQMMVEFSESPEYRALIGNEVYVTMTYVGMLRRAPDATGFSFWVSYMDSGNAGLALIDGLLAAPEYRSRFLP